MQSHSSFHAENINENDSTVLSSGQQVELLEQALLFAQSRTRLSEDQLREVKLQLETTIIPFLTKRASEDVIRVKEIIKTMTSLSSSNNCDPDEQRGGTSVDTTIDEDIKNNNNNSDSSTGNEQVLAWLRQWDSERSTCHVLLSMLCNLVSEITKTENKFIPVNKQQDDMIIALVRRTIEAETKLAQLQSTTATATATTNVPNDDRPHRQQQAQQQCNNNNNNDQLHQQQGHNSSPNVDEQQQQHEQQQNNFAPAAIDLSVVQGFLFSFISVFKSAWMWVTGRQTATAYPSSDDDEDDEPQQQQQQQHHDGSNGDSTYSNVVVHHNNTEYYHPHRRRPHQQQQQQQQQQRPSYNPRLQRYQRTETEPTSSSRSSRSHAAASSSDDYIFTNSWAAHNHNRSNSNSNFLNGLISFWASGSSNHHSSNESKRKKHEYTSGNWFENCIWPELL